MKPTASRRELIAGGGTVLAAGLAGCTVSAEEVQTEFREEYDAESVADLTVETTNGDVTVRAEDRSTIDVRGRKEAASESALEDVTLNATRDGDRLTLAVDYEAGLLGRLIGNEPAMDLELAVPESLSGLRATSVNGRVTVEDLVAEVAAETTNGDVRIRRLRGSAAVESTNGDVEIDLAEVRDDVTVDTTNGDVEVRAPPSADLAVSLDSVNGDLSVRGFDAVSAGDASAEVGDGTHEVRLDTTNGDVAVVARE